MSAYENENELYHHGILGQKWGVRRYQNADGSLTAKGAKRYGTKTNFEKVQAAKRAAEKANSPEAKRRAKQNARAAAEVEKYRKKAGIKSDDDSSATTSKKLSKREQKKAEAELKKKKIKDMSNEELQAQIDRLNLEAKYRNAVGDQVPTGQRVAKEIGETALDMGKTVAKSVASDTLSKYANKKVSEMLGMGEDEVAALKKQADMLGYKKQIQDHMDAMSEASRRRNAAKTESETLKYENEIHSSKRTASNRARDAHLDDMRAQVEAGRHEADLYNQRQARSNRKYDEAVSNYRRQAQGTSAAKQTLDNMAYMRENYPDWYEANYGSLSRSSSSRSHGTSVSTRRRRVAKHSDADGEVMGNYVSMSMKYPQYFVDVFNTKMPVEKELSHSELVEIGKKHTDELCHHGILGQKWGGSSLPE